MKFPERIRRFVAKTFGFRYAAAQNTRITGNLFARNTSADAEILRALAPMRDRARTLERDDDWTRKYLSTTCDNVLGANGVKMDVKVTERKKDKDGNWYTGVDEQASSAIERAFKEWCRAQNCDISRKLTFAAQQHLGLRTTKRDGEVLTEMYFGSRAKNKFGFAIRLFESDHLDHRYNVASLGNGNSVRMGVEMDGDGVVVAYHFLEDHPGDVIIGQSSFRRVRVEARNLIHTMDPERIGQTRGVTALCSTIITLHQLNDYEKAELTAARIGAKKLGFFTKEFPEGYEGDGEDENGNTFSNLEDGSFQELPTGMDIKAFDVGHPNPQQKDFIKVYLRKLAAGLGMSYTSLSGDLEGVNLSSIRSGLNDERERYKTMQRWFIDNWLQIIFENWLQAALLKGVIVLDNGKPLPAEKFDKFNAVVWTPRRWAYVDPKTDVEAAVLAINNNLKSPRRVIAESGEGDNIELYDEIEADNAAMDERGLKKQTVSGQMVSASEPSENTDTNPADSNADTQQAA